MLASNGFVVTHAIRFHNIIKACQELSREKALIPAGKNQYQGRKLKIHKKACEKIVLHPIQDMCRLSFFSSRNC